jgi:SAM-dependent methyltransferase
MVLANPFVAPFLLFTEIQAGSLLRQGHFHALSVAAVRAGSPWGFAADLLLGSALVGGALGVSAAIVTWAVVGQHQLEADDEAIVTAAAARYLSAGIPAWELANGKLRGDPVYRDVLRLVPLPQEGCILDLGCGRGLMLAMLAAAGATMRPEPGWELRGIEYRPRMVRIGRRALGEAADIEQGDLTTCDLPACRAALILDVLHLLPGEAQDALMRRVAAAVAPGGILVIREADAAGGWRFRAGQACNRAMAVLQGRWERRFHFRTAAEWAALLQGFGFEVQGDPRGHDAVYANVLLWARRR